MHLETQSGSLVDPLLMVVILGLLSGQSLEGQFYKPGLPILKPTFSDRPEHSLDG